MRDIVLPELMTETKLTKSGFADAIKLSRQQIHQILYEKQPVTPETAVKLEATIGGQAIYRGCSRSGLTKLRIKQRKVDRTCLPSCAGRSALNGAARAPTRANHWSYDLKRHLGLLSAYQGELAMLRLGSIGTQSNCTPRDSATG